MDSENVVKVLVLVVGAAIGPIKLFYDIWIARRSRTREEYYFAKEFLSEVKDNKNLHPFLKAKGYQAVAGDTKLRGEEIEYLLSLQEPDRALSDYVLGQGYLEHFPHTGTVEITYKKPFKASWSRWLLKSLFLGGYIVMYLLAAAPFVWPFFFERTAVPSGLVVSTVVCGFSAWFSLKELARLVRAEKLVKRQQKHSQVIII